MIMEYNDILNAMNEQKLNYEKILNENEVLKSELETINNKLFRVCEPGLADPLSNNIVVGVNSEMLEEIFRTLNVGKVISAKRNIEFWLE